MLVKGAVTVAGRALVEIECDDALQNALTVVGKFQCGDLEAADGTFESVGADSISSTVIADLTAVECTSMVNTGTLQVQGAVTLANLTCGDIVQTWHNLRLWVLTPSL